MPEAIAAALVAAGWSTTAATIAAWVITIAATVAYGNYAQRKAQARARAAANASAKDRELMIRSAVAPRRVIYGRDKISGPVVYMQSTGPKKEFLHIVVALAAHECDAIEEIYFNDILLPALDGDGFVTSGEFVGAETEEVGYFTGTTSGAGAITLPHNADSLQAVFTESGDGTEYTQSQIDGYSHTAGSNTITGLPASTDLRVTYTYTIPGTPRARVRKFLGAAGQVADPDLITESAGLWTAAHVGTGICYLYVRLEFDQDVFGAIGVPNISAVVRGKKVYDPRTDTTLWTNNAALCLADYLKSQEGMRADDAEVPDAEVITAANICDEDIDLDEESEDTQKRYTADLSFTTETSPRDVLSELAQCMAGRAVWTQGRWLVRAGAHRTPTLTINADMLAPGSISVVPRASRSELFNAVRARHRNVDEKYAEVQAPLVENAGYEAEDGGVQIVRQIDIPTLADTYRAQRLAKIELERARQALTVRLTCNLRAYDLAPTDTVMVTLAQYGWTAKVFEVIERTITREATLQYTLRETAAGVWEWNFGEATVGDLAPNTDLPNPYEPPAALTGLTATSQAVLQTDGTVVLQALLEWTASTDAFVRGGGKVEVQWAKATLETITTLSVPGTADDATVGPLVGDLAYIARIRQVNAVGRAGPWTYVNWVAQSDFTGPEDVADLAYEIKPFQVVVSWAPCVARDYALTELRVGASWAAGDTLWLGKANEYKHARPANGTYTVWAAHKDTSGNYSDTPQSLSVTVDDTIDEGGGGTLRLTTDRFPFFSFSTGTTHTAQAPGDTPITFTALLFGLFGTASWAAEAFDNRIGGSSLGAVTLGGAGNERTMSAAQFVAPGSSGSVERVRVTATLGGSTDFIDVYRQDPTTTAPFLFLSNPQHQVPTDESGEFGDYSGASTAAVVFEGITDTTDDWDFSITPDAGVTATINGGSGPVANPTSVTVAVSAMTVATGIVTITAEQVGEADLTADFIVDKQEASGSGYVFHFTPRTEILLDVNDAGDVVSYDDAWSELKIIKGGTLDDTANWSLTKEDVNVTSTLVANKVTVTALLAPGTLGAAIVHTFTMADLGGSTSALSGVYYGGGVWIALGNGGAGTRSKIFRSTDFIDWAVVDVGDTANWSLAAYDQGAWVLVRSSSATNTHKIRRSTDGGLTWSEVTLPTASNTQWYDLKAGGGRMVLSALSVTGGAYSTNGGATWSTWTQPIAGLRILALSASMSLAMSTTGVPYFSTNHGSTWTSDDANWPTDPFQAIVYKGRLVVSFWDNATTARYRDPGGSWVTVALPGTMSQGWFQIVADVLYMGQNAGGTPQFTTDGVTWKLCSGAGGSRPVLGDQNQVANFLPAYAIGGYTVARVPLSSSSDTEGAVIVTATKAGALDIEAVLPVLKGTAPRDVYAFSANPGHLVLPATSDGLVTSFANATIQLAARRNNVDDTANWTWSWTTTNLTPASGTGSTITITAMPNNVDTGTITVTYTKPGQVMRQDVLGVVKLKGSTPSGPRIGAAFAVISTTTTHLTIRFKTDGRVQVRTTSGGAFVDYTTWAGAIAAGVGAGYWVNVILEAGTHALTSGTTNSWLALTSDRDFTMEDASSGTHTCSFMVLFSAAADGSNPLACQGSMRLIVP